MPLIEKDWRSGNVEDSSAAAESAMAAKGRVVSAVNTPRRDKVTVWLLISFGVASVIAKYTAPDYPGPMNKDFGRHSVGRSALIKFDTTGHGLRSTRSYKIRK